MDKALIPRFIGTKVRRMEVAHNQPFTECALGRLTQSTLIKRLSIIEFHLTVQNRRKSRRPEEKDFVVRGGMLVNKSMQRYLPSVVFQKKQAISGGRRPTGGV
jgi:hypothetical protein